ncbi:MAG TPA: hypothetical protein VKE24_04595 [Candidatus Acidoferrales bacterium]|nr:hypothetical protein [Candidatus Acidoferrales bacterium]
MSPRLVPSFSGPLGFLLLLLLLPALTAEEATIIYRRVFKASNPEFIEIKVGEKGTATFDIRQLEDPPGAQPFEMGPALRAKIFELAGQLNDFRNLQLDIRRRIANLGEKTFRYERGAEAHEARFNYTLNSTANQLVQIFEGLARQQEHLVLLQRRMRYDRLGINEALLQLESDLNRKLLPEPERLLPVLEQIANDSRFVDIARQRARALAERTRNPREH